MFRKILVTIVVLSFLLTACAPAAAPAPAQAQPAAQEQKPAEQVQSEPAAAAAPAEQAAAPAGFGETLKAVQARGKVRVGTQNTSQAFGYVDTAGKFSGFDIDYSKAIAAAIFGDSEKVEFVVTTGETRFPTLQNGDTDVLIRNSTNTFSRDTELGLTPTMIYFYDGQGLIVPKAKNFKTLEDMDGATICMDRGTTTEANIADAMGMRNLTYTPLLMDNTPDEYAALDQGRCDALTGDRSGLVSDRIKLKNVNDYEILDITLSKEPFSPYVRHGDDQWADIVKWVFYVPIIAEEHGITQANVDDVKANSADPEVRRLLGVEGEMGAKLGLPNEWAYNVIKAVGNYAEMYERNFGETTETYLSRGINALWKDGGLLYAPPLR
jgi:general L-amino acid transport system substrate-binding protein